MSRFSAGPHGYRVHVIDYDATSGAWRAPARLPAGVNCECGPPRDPFEDAPDEKLSETAPSTPS